MNPPPPKIQGVATNVAAFIGLSPIAAPPVLLHSFTDYQKLANAHGSAFVTSAVSGFFQNGGTACYVLFAPLDQLLAALETLSKLPLSLLACPDQQNFANADALLAEHCEKTANRICALHAPSPTVDIATYRPPVHSSYAAYYHPWLEGMQGITHLPVPPDGHVLGTLAQSNVIKSTLQAPELHGVSVLSQILNEIEAEALNAQNINTLRFFTGRGNVVWGSRTASNDPNWKYLTVRRFAIYLEQSIQQGLQWTVFEPNGPALWANVRQSVENFLFNIWHQGGLRGAKPQDAFFVRCDTNTMTPADIAAGNLNLNVGFAPLRPAEFLVIKISSLVKPGIS